MIVDISGDMQPDLLGLASENGGKSTSFKSWRNLAGAFSLCAGFPPEVPFEAASR
jgi:hypothetical protein